MEPIKNTSEGLFVDCISIRIGLYEIPRPLFRYCLITKETVEIGRTFSSFQKQRRLQEGAIFWKKDEHVNNKIKNKK